MPVFLGVGKVWDYTSRWSLKGQSMPVKRSCGKDIFLLLQQGVRTYVADFTPQGAIVHLRRRDLVRRKQDCLLHSQHRLCLTGWEISAWKLWVKWHCCCLSTIMMYLHTSSAFQPPVLQQHRRRNRQSLANKAATSMLFCWTMMSQVKFFTHVISLSIGCDKLPLLWVRPGAHRQGS